MDISTKTKYIFEETLSNLNIDIWPRQRKVTQSGSMQIENLPSSKVNIDFSSILSPKYMFAIWICPVAKFNKYSKKLKNQQF